MGVPLSWHKLQLAGSLNLKWIGWATLPEDTRAVLRAALRPLCHVGACVSRRELRRLAGRLSWFTAGLRWLRLRPWLAMLFHALAKPKLRLQCLDSTQMEELARALDSSLTVRSCCVLSNVQAGWRVLEAANQPVSRVRDLLSARTRSGRVWTKLADSLDSGPVTLWC